MKIEPEDFRRHYESLSDEALLEIDRNELVPIAQQIYDQEVGRRDLALDQTDDPPADEEQPVSGFHEDANWGDNTACAYSAYVQRAGDDATQRMLLARDMLTAAGIPAELSYRKEKPENREMDVCEVVVPAQLILYAGSLIEKEIFNAEHEKAYRLYFSSLSDEELRSVDRNLLFGGLVDRLERVRRAYGDEVSKRAGASSV